MMIANEVRVAVSLSPTVDASPIVFVVDDDLSARESTESLLRGEGWSVESFSSAEEFSARPRESSPTCLILDIELPGITGLELQRRLAVERPNMPIIFLTAQSSIPMTVQAMKAGAFEFLTKPTSDETLLMTVESAFERSRVLCGREAELHSLKNRYTQLTSRERDVFALVVAGLPNKQVGGHLGISEITVKQHRGNVMRKMDADSLPQLVKMATRLRLTRSVNQPSQIRNQVSGELIASKNTSLAWLSTSVQ
jgi:FixJ family two-component response regulator